MKYIRAESTTILMSIVAGAPIFMVKNPVSIIQQVRFADSAKITISMRAEKENACFVGKNRSLFRPFQSLYLVSFCYV